MLAEIKRKMIGEIFDTIIRDKEFIETNLDIGSMLGAGHYISNIHLTKIEVGFMDIEVVTKEWE